ncbi:MAG: Gmad2 immunoglobulin-like domain-containing protein [bacterium]|nr:Gmad2 immunoglobulin-like domain-containing protein [bacterium]
METPPKQNIRLRKREIVIIAFGMLLVVGALAWAIDVVQNKRVLPENKSPKTATDSATPYCQGGVVYQNKKQGYQLCLRSVEEIKDTSKAQNGTSLTLELKSVFVATQSAKQATASASAVSIEVAPPALVQVSSNLDIVKTQSLKVAGTEAEKAVYNTPKKPGFRTEVVSLTKFKRHFSFKFTSEIKNFATDSSFLQALLDNLRFLEGTSDPPWSSSGMFIVETPWTGDTIANPVTIRGQGEVFEAVINLRIKDKDGNILISTTTKTAVGQELSNFSKTVKYKKPSTKQGSIEIFTISAKDGKEQNKIVIPVIFKTGK